MPGGDTLRLLNVADKTASGDGIRGPERVDRRRERDVHADAAGRVPVLWLRRGRWYAAASELLRRQGDLRVPTRYRRRATRGMGCSRCTARSTIQVDARPQA